MQFKLYFRFINMDIFVLLVLFLQLDLNWAEIAEGFKYESPSYLSHEATYSITTPCKSSEMNYY